LAEVDAKRRIIDLHDDVSGGCRTCMDAELSNDGPDAAAWPCPTLRLLALPYADHPGYREEWA